MDGGGLNEGDLPMTVVNGSVAVASAATQAVFQTASRPHARGDRRRARADIASDACLGRQRRRFLVRRDQEDRDPGRRSKTSICQCSI